MVKQKNSNEMLEKDDFIISNRFKIIKKLGEGGMADVFLAEDVKLKRKVAIKKIPVQVILGASSKDRFLREAQTASQLEHPNICPIYEIYEDDENDYIVMQYVEGVTLSQIIKLNKLGIRKILDIAIQVCDGMIEANLKGIIHRDIKPANIMIDRRGTVKILDFGLAKIKDRSFVKKNKMVDTNLTGKGLVIGTVSYMSPEQVREEPLDPRTDIFSFGCVLYEMLEGVDPFHDTEQIAILYNVLNKRVEFEQTIPEALKRIVLTALEKDRDKRYDSFMEFKEALDSSLFQYKDRKEKEVEDSGFIRPEEEIIETQRTSDIEKLSEIVDRVRKMRATTDPFNFTKKQRIRFIVLPLVLLLAAFIVFFLINRQRGPTTTGRDQKFFIYLHDFQNETGEAELAEMINFLVFESLNQFRSFKSINHEVAASIFKYKNEEGKEKAPLKKFDIRYELKGRISRIKDIINIEVIFQPYNREGKSFSLTIPGLANEDSLLIHQIDTLARQIYDKIFPERQESLSLKKISKVYGSSWEKFTLFFRGLRHLKKLEASEAANYFKDSLELPISKISLAEIFVFAGLRPRAVKLINEIIPEIDSLPNSQKFKVLAMKARLDFNFSEEVKYLKKLNDEFPFSKEAFFELGEAYFHNGNAEKAIPYYNRALELYPAYSKAINHLGYCYSYLGDHNKALELFEDYRDLDSSANSFDSLGDGYFYAGDYISAEACKKAAISMDKKIVFWSYRTLVNVYIMRAEYTRSQRCLDDYDNIINPEKSNADILAVKAFIYYQNRDYMKALEMINLSLAIFDFDDINANSAETHWIKGIILLSLGRTQESQKELQWLENFKKKYRLSWDNFSVPFKFFIHLQSLLLEARDRIGEAEKAFKNLVSMKSQLSYRTTFLHYQFFHTEYAKFLLRRNQTERALIEIHKCLQFNKNYVPALWVEAEILEEANDPARFAVYRKITNIYGESNEKNHFRDILKGKIN